MRSYKVLDSVDAHLADDGIVHTISSGDIVVSIKTPRRTKKGVLTNVSHISKLSKNLFSLVRFTYDVGSVTLTKDGWHGKTK